MTDTDPSTRFESRLLADLIAAQSSIEPLGASAPARSGLTRLRVGLAAIAVLAAIAAVLGFVVFNGGQATASAAEIKSRALAALSSADLILHEQQTTETEHSDLWQDTATYRTRNVTFASDGRPLTETVRTREGDTMHLDTVIYALHAWLTASLPTTSPASGSVSDDYAQNIKDQLSAGIFVLIGPETVDGRRTLHLRQNRPPSPPPPNAPSGYNPPSPTRIDMWIDPTTYLPVRSESIAASGQVLEETDFEWLPRTAANLANLDLVVPPGFAHATERMQIHTSGNGTYSGSVPLP